MSSITKPSQRPSRFSDGSVAGPSSIPFGLPDHINNRTRIPWAQLPIDRSSIIHWQEYRSPQETGQDLNVSLHDEVVLQSQESLLQCSFDVFESTRQKGFEKPILDSCLKGHVLQTCQKTGLWVLQRCARSRHTDQTDAFTSNKSQSKRGFWFFTIQDHDVPKTLLKVQADLKRAKFVYSKGSFRLSEAYKNPIGLELNDPTLLTPRSEVQEPLKMFFRSLDNHFLDRWTWNHILSNCLPNFSTLSTLSSKDARNVGAIQNDTLMDDDEEGALIGNNSENASGNDPEHPSEDLFWDFTWKHRCMTRFGRGVVLQEAPKESSGQFVNPPGESIHHFALRSFMDGNGNVYISTYPRDLGCNREVQPDEKKGTQIFLAPIGTQASFLSYIGSLHVDGEDRPSSHINYLRTIQDKFLNLLKIRGASTAGLSDEWIICEDSNNTIFVWPLRLCFTASSNSSRVDVAKQKSSLNLENATGKALHLVSDGLWDDTLTPKSELEDRNDEQPLTMGIQDDAEGSSAEGIVEASSPSKTVHSESHGSKSSQIVDIGSQNLLKSSAEPDLLKGVHPVSMKEKEDLDLWGSLGFNESEDVQMNPPPRSRDGLEDNGFGLVTEDDFSFFDDAGVSFAAFDEDIQGPEPDMQMKETHLPSTTVSTAVEDHATNYAAIVDPPSLPGFTPGSFSTSSPTVGGVSGKTPRTPFSPYNDLVDAQVAIEGEVDHGFYQTGDPSVHHIHGTSDQSSSHLASNYDQNILSPRESHGWIQRNRREIPLKYEQGKFAMPLPPSGRKKGHDQKDANSHSVQRHRSRLASKATESGRRLLHPSGAPSMAKLQKARLRAFGQDEEGSEATEEGTLSDQSSLMENDSDDNESVSSDEITQEDESLLIERTEFLKRAIGIVQSKEYTLEDSVMHGSIRKNDNQLQAMICQFSEYPFLRSDARVHHCAVAYVKELSKQGGAHLFSPVAGFLDSAHLGTIFGQSSDTSMQPQVLEPPNIVVGCQGQVTKMKPTALAFWDKLHLHSVSGYKHVVAFVLHGGVLSATTEKAVRSWFGAIGDAFSTKGLGTHVLADESFLSIGGSRHAGLAQFLQAISLKSDQWVDTLESLFTRFSAALSAGKHVVLYSIGEPRRPTPYRAFSMLESSLRSLAKERLEGHDKHILVRPISWDLVHNSGLTFDNALTDAMHFATSLYNSMQVSVSPYYNTEVHLPRFTLYAKDVHHPSFTVSQSDAFLAESMDDCFTLDQERESSNLLDRGLLLHVGYKSAKHIGGTSFLAIIDERAQEHNVTGWTRENLELPQELERIWSQVVQYAHQVRVKWHIVICKQSPMHLDEVMAWSQKLDKTVLDSIYALDVTLTCIDENSPMALISPLDGHGEDSVVSHPIHGSNSNLCLDASKIQYAIYSPNRTVLPCSSSEDSEILTPLCSALYLSVPLGWNGSMSTRVETLASSTIHNDPVFATPATTPHHLWIHILQVYRCASQTGESDRPNSDKTAQMPNDSISGILHARMSRILNSFHSLELISRQRAFLLEPECANLPWHVAMVKSLSGISSVFQVSGPS